MGKRRVSEEDLLACSSTGDGCQGGNANYVYTYVSENGHAFADQYPLRSTGAVEFPCWTNRTSLDLAYVGKLVYVSGTTDEMWMRELMLNGPAYVSFTVYDSFYRCVSYQQCWTCALGWDDGLVVDPNPFVFDLLLCSPVAESERKGWSFSL